jgi:hypothetical protein
LRLFLRLYVVIATQQIEMIKSEENFYQGGMAGTRLL